MPKWIRDGKATNKVPHHAEGPFAPTEVRTAGVMTMKQQIIRLQAASEVQQAWKNAHYPAAEEVPDDFIPPDYNPTEMELIDEARRVVNGRAATKAVARKQIDEKKKAATEQPIEEPAPEPPPEA